MDPVQFLRTIYLGDRGLKSLLIDSESARVVLTIDRISRCNDTTGRWDFRNIDDIVDGRIVLTGVTWIALEPAGYIPNDYINEFVVEPLESTAAEYRGAPYLFKFSVGHVSKFGGKVESAEVLVKVAAKAVHLEDPL